MIEEGFVVNGVENEQGAYLSCYEPMEREMKR